MVGNRRRRDDDADQDARARLRLSALRPRGGWVPRVPDAARALAAPGGVLELATLGHNEAVQRDGAGAGAQSADRTARPRVGGDLDAGRAGRHRRDAHHDAEPERDANDEAKLEADRGARPDVARSKRVDADRDAHHDAEPERDANDEAKLDADRGARPDVARSKRVDADRDARPDSQGTSLAAKVLANSVPAGIRGGELGLQRPYAIVIGLVVAIGLVVVLFASDLGQPDVATNPGPTSSVLATGTPVRSSAEPEQDGEPDRVVVHVAGEVARPGVVELPAGSRVMDAVTAAGGAAAGVDLSTLNLARILVDGEQVAVGIEPLALAVPPAHAAPGPVNLNIATVADLETLPGIGPTLAAAIVAWREENGRFSTIEELLEVSGIGTKKFEALADLVTV